MSALEWPCAACGAEAGEECREWCTARSETVEGPTAWEWFRETPEDPCET